MTHTEAQVALVRDHVAGRHSEAWRGCPVCMTVVARHHYRRQRGATGCRLCGRVVNDPRHWEANLED